MRVMTMNASGFCFPDRHAFSCFQPPQHRSIQTKVRQQMIIQVLELQQCLLLPAAYSQVLKRLFYSTEKPRLVLLLP